VLFLRRLSEETDVATNCSLPTLTNALAFKSGSPDPLCRSVYLAFTSTLCKSKPQKKVCKTVLKHFDAQYSEELGEQWHSARDVLLNPLSWQYGVLLNRFSDRTNLKQWLAELGYTNLLPQTHPKSQTAHIPLQCFIHQDPVRIPTQSHHPGWLKQYFLLNAASLLPVLSLNLKEGENVLDLCAAPGGKSLAILQTVTPGKSRYMWRIMPIMQFFLKVGSALAAVRPGGVVVYSTCTMSRAENQSVVEAVLASYQGVELLELEQHLIDSLSDNFCFAHFHPSVGQLVIPQKDKTWGPMYVSRLQRIY
uniref:NOP2/Sun RNA methyltransferase 3 n=1 Tax=Sinocyclocheilus grahami TaxID=75366 RepID=A0A672L289_SINGR